MQETTFSADRGQIVIYGVIHLFVSIVVFLFFAGCQLYLMDSGKDSSPLPLGFYVVFGIDFLLGLPVRSPMWLAASYFEIGGSIFNSFYWFALIMLSNSLLAAMAFDFVSRWRQNRRSAIQNSIN
jgi:hypothetical protein